VREWNSIGYVLAAIPAGTRRCRALKLKDSTAAEADLKKAEKSGKIKIRNLFTKSVAQNHYQEKICGKVKTALLTGSAVFLLY
jgi:hypothetical protein